jgi:hypothetical protein
VVWPGNKEKSGTSRRDTVTFQGLNSCNHALSVDVISRSNQFGANSIQFLSNSKSRSDFQF